MKRHSPAFLFDHELKNLQNLLLISLGSCCSQKTILFCLYCSFNFLHRQKKHPCYFTKFRVGNVIIGERLLGVIEEMHTV